MFRPKNLALKGLRSALVWGTITWTKAELLMIWPWKCFENAVCKVATILFQSQCVKWLLTDVCGNLIDYSAFLYC